MRKKVLTKPSFISIVGIIALMLSTIPLQAQTSRRSPLVIGIMVEGLTDDYISLLEPYFGDGGFRKLINGGVRITDLDFGPDIDPTAAAAIIQTGAAPVVNGIPSATVYSPATDRAIPILNDTKSMGNFTDENYSPASIKVSTLADELRMATDGEGMVYGIATDPQISIISAGHAANGAFWIYDHTGNWATSTYYKEMPSTVSNRNYRTPLKSRLDTMAWTPLRPMSDYPLLTKSERSKPFRHTYPSKQFDRFRNFKLTPMANREVTDLGIELINSAKLGRDESTDMLLLTYNVSAPGASRAETMDLYLRLDRDLARLFEAASKASPATSPTIFLTGLPAKSQYAADDKKWRVPTGEYSIRKAMSLLEMYLIGIHGNGDWVTGYHNRHFYLNRKFITDKGMNLAQFRTEVADFLARMAGVSNVYTIDDIIASRAGNDPQGLKRNISVEHSGDVIVEINPGWVIVDNPSTPQKSTVAERMSPESIPAFIAGPSVANKRIDTPVDARAIAPAVARLLRIRAPNAAADGSLRIN